MTDPAAFLRNLDALRADRAEPQHRYGSPEYHRQEGELNAFAMVRRLFLTGDPRG